MAATVVAVVWAAWAVWISKVIAGFARNNSPDSIALRAFNPARDSLVLRHTKSPA